MILDLNKIWEVFCDDETIFKLLSRFNLIRSINKKSFIEIAYLLKTLKLIFYVEKIPILKKFIFNSFFINFNFFILF